MPAPNRHRTNDATSNPRFLVSNVARCSVPTVSVPVSYLPYRDSEHLVELRRAHRGTHIFRRIENRLQCIRLDGKDSDLGADSERIEFHENLSLCAALTRNALIDLYFTRKCEILDFQPVEIISGSTQQNLLATVLSGVQIPEWLSIRQLCEMDVRVFNNADGPFLGIAVNLRIRKRLLCTCDRLLALGIDLHGLRVAVQTPSDDPRVQALRKTLGRVAEIADSVIHLKAAREQITKVAATQAYLALDPEALRRVLRILFGAKSAEVAIKLEGAVASLSQGKTRLERLESVLSDLQRQKLEILPGIHVKVGQFLSEAEQAFSPVNNVPKATFVFDPAGRKLDAYKPRGLDKFGPYTAQTFSPNQPRVCVVCEASRKGDVEQFLYKFFNGVNASGLQYPPHAKGFCRAYHLAAIKPEFFVSNGPIATAYHKAAQAALDSQAEATARWDLALVQTTAATHDLSPDENPYLICKASFHSHQIPVQEFEAETMQLPSSNLEYALSNMALASYAKLGGVPWLLKADPTIAHEFVVGLGSSYVLDEAAGSNERVVGITTIFSGDGNYFLSNISRAVPIEEFRDALLGALRSSFEQARNKMNWQPGELVRLVFHSFKPMKDAEAEAVIALASEMQEYTVEFAFLHVVDDHPYLLFDTHERGAWDPVGKATKGAYVPARGLSQVISRRETLVTLTGPKELKRAQDGMPFPVLLRLHRDSTFRDMDYLARQVFHFSDHSWRTFLPASMPVTISYSQLIARMMGNLARLPRWDPDSMRGRLGRSRWFL